MDSMLLEKVYRRVQMLFGRGRATYVDDSGPVQKVQVKMSDIETADNRLRLAEFGFTSNPPNGSDVAVLHVAGDRGAGVVVATNHQSSRPTGLQSGESMLYSEDGKQVYMTAGGGIVVNANNQPVTVNGATTVTIVAATEVLMDTPILKCTGDIIDNCNANQHTIAQMRTIANEHEHEIEEVQTGGSTVISQPPNQQM